MREDLKFEVTENELTSVMTSLFSCQIKRERARKAIFPRPELYGSVRTSVSTS